MRNTPMSLTWTQLLTFLPAALGLLLIGVLLYWNLRRDRTFDGFWLMDGYGMALEIKGGRARVLEVTTVSCLEAYRLDVLGGEIRPLALRLGMEGDELTMRRATGEEFHARRVASLPAVCAQPGGKSGDPVYNFEVLWHTFNEQYAFFDLYNVDWQAQYNQYRPRVTADTTPDELFGIFAEMLTPLNDSHVTLTRDEKNSVEFGTDALNTPFFNDAVEYMRTHVTRREGTTALANRRLFYRHLDERTGYIFLAGMAGYNDDVQAEIATAGSAIDQALQDLAGVDTLIIDNRFNLGGYDGVALELASRFAPDGRKVYTKQARLGDGFTADRQIDLEPRGQTFDGRVILLNSRLTVSAAEIFVMAMSTLPNVTIIGETTDGHFSDALTRQLPNGWQITLSNEVYRDSNGQVHEGGGLEPHMSIPFDLSALAKGDDAILQAALERAALAGE